MSRNTPKPSRPLALARLAAGAVLAATRHRCDEAGAPFMNDRFTRVRR